jgi:hypothetical protein
VGVRYGIMCGMRDSLSVLASAGRLFLAHWPALLTLGLLGVAVRNGALWGAVELSQWNSFVAQILLIITPLGYLLPVVGMLWVCAPSMPNLARARVAHAPVLPSERRERRLIDVALSVLVPFLVVYEIEGFLQADRDRFLNEVAADELFNDLFSAEGMDLVSRLGVWDGPTLLLMVAGAFIVRWLLGLLEGKLRFLGLAVLGGCLEIYWTGQAAAQASQLEGRLWRTAEELRLVDTVVGAAGVAQERVGADAGAVVEGVSGSVGTAIQSLDVVLFAPLAWLTIGAVVLGHRLMEPPSTEHGILDRLTWLPQGLRAVLESVTEDLRARFSAMWNGLRLTARAGLGTILMFCLAYLLAMRAPVAVGWLVRAVTGPVETKAWLDFSAMEVGAGLAISLALAAVLIAATVDTLIERGLALPEAPEDEAASGATEDRPTRTPDPRTQPVPA